MNSHELIWRGKDLALDEASADSRSSLQFLPEASLYPDSARNIYIEGDNLEALRLLKYDYAGKVGMIYIDPPYNTGKNFIYRDSFDAHSGWLNMMYPRLSLARQLLSDNGVIFISIDINELANLKLLCDEIFGEKNFVEIFTWTKTSTPHSLSPKSRRTVEFILCYEKNLSGRKFFGEPLLNEDAPLLNAANPVKTITFPAGSVKFRGEQAYFEKGCYKSAELLRDFSVEKNLNTTDIILKGRFKWSQEKVLEEINCGTYFLVKSDRFSIRYQRSPARSAFKPPTNLLGMDQSVGTNESAVKELAELDLNGVFDYPKPVSLIQKLIRMACYDQEDCTVLDFFSGSGSTAHAVMLENFLENTNRRFIMIQKAEPCPAGSRAYSAGFKNISEIGAERIRRAAEKIKLMDKKKDPESVCKTYTEPDSGFKYYRVKPAPEPKSP